MFAPDGQTSARQFPSVDAIGREFEYDVPIRLDELVLLARVM
jgi:hypothetical protein